MLKSKIYSRTKLKVYNAKPLTLECSHSHTKTNENKCNSYDNDSANENEIVNANVYNNRYSNNNTDNTFNYINNSTKVSCQSIPETGNINGRLSHKRKAEKIKTGSQIKKTYSTVEHFWKNHYSKTKDSSLKASVIYEFYKKLEGETYESYESFKRITG